MENDSTQESKDTGIAGTGTDLQDNPKDKTGDDLDLIKEFNAILGDHIERLLDTRFGIEELELNIFSISCIVLLATRETEIETFPASPPPRYTEESLIEELGEMSIEPAGEVSKVVEDMIDKNYLKVTDDRFFCNKPMSSMAQLFDRVFPNMPGLNLVAYLGQMIDEVTAGRKLHEEAFKQFNQMLEIQGVSINESAASKPAKKKFSHLRLGDDTPPEKKVRRPIVVPGKPANIFSQLKTGNVIKSPSIIRAKTPASTEKEIADNTAASAEGEAIADSNSADAIQAASDNAVDSHLSEEARTAENATDLSDQQERTSDGFEPLDDKEIEDRILEFEEQLGLKCPLCGTGGIKTSETAKGKAYYHCSNSVCNFISWGKPYYFECPKCSSNFLIEVTDSNGKNFLKCPKATCTHWQKFPWEMSDQDSAHSSGSSESGGAAIKPKRKVRRRVVRRKR